MSGPTSKPETKRGSRQGQAQPPELHDRARTAVHEAAHLAVAELFPCSALEVLAVTIADQGPFAGGLIARTPDLLPRRELRALTAVLLAGFEAEWQFLGKPAFEHAVTDLRQAYVLCTALGRYERRPPCEVWREIQLRTRRLVSAHWSSVEHLAVALVRHTVVDGDHARKIVRTHVPAGTNYVDGLRSGDFARAPVPPPPPQAGARFPSRPSSRPSSQPIVRYVPRASSR